MRRSLALVLLLSAAFAASPAGAAERSFSTRFTETLHGDIEIAGNVLHTCDLADTGGVGGTCANARAGTAPSFVNNNHALIQVDVDADPSTFNSSDATLVLPAGAEVRFAGLYWGAPGLGSGGGAAAPDFAQRSSVLLDTPASLGYLTLTGAAVDDLAAPADIDDYVAFKDVTAAVAAGGPGSYRVANVQAATGLDTYAGWALVVAYDAPGEQLRNVSVFDGYQFMNDDGPGVGHSSVTNAISGFRTPAAGPVVTRAGVIGYEGEVTTGSGLPESVSVDGTAINGGALNPTDDFFNGSITRLGARVTAKNPDQVGQLGSLDADVVQASGLLAPGATSATVELVANANDGWYAQVLTFATDVQQPLVELTKSVVDVDGAPTRAGDVLEYTVTAANVGNDAADTVTVTDVLPGALQFVPGSLVVDGAPTSDAADADAGDAVGATLTGRLGTVNAGAQKAFRFRAVVAPGTATGSTVSNSATATYRIPASAVQLNATGPPAEVVIAAPAAAPAQTTPTSGTTSTSAAPPEPPVAAVVVPTVTQSVSLPGAVPVFTSVVKLPSTKACVSRRKFRIRLVAPKNDPIRDATVLVNGRKVKTVRSDRVRAPVDLRGLPKGRFTVKITVRTVGGRTIVGTRKYRTCVARTLSGRRPKV